MESATVFHLNQALRFYLRLGVQATFLSFKSRFPRFFQDSLFKISKISGLLFS